MVISSQDFQSAMHVGLDRPDGLAQRLGGLGVRQLMDVPEHDRLPIAQRQAGHAGDQRVDLGPPDDVRLRAHSTVGLVAVQLHQTWPSPSHAVAEDVDRDPRSEEHTYELQSPDHLVCSLLLEKKKYIIVHISLNQLLDDVYII